MSNVRVLQQTGNLIRFMSPVYHFLFTYEGLIYILLALGGLFSVRWLWRSLRECRESVFGLEREFALRRLSRSLIVTIFLVLLFISELFLASFILPDLPASDWLATPTLDLVNQQNGALSGNPTTILTSPTPIPPLTGDGGNGCVAGQLILTSPESGEEVSGKVQLMGTVNIPDFGFYKYEFSPQGLESWVTVSAGAEIKNNGELGIWDTSTLTPGDYELRLVVTDSQGAVLPPCVAQVHVVAPAP